MTQFKRNDFLKLIILTFKKHNKNTNLSQPTQQRKKQKKKKCNIY